MWGQVRSIRYFPDSVGIIPTRVGTSPDKQIICRFAQDHPHACGDKAVHVVIRVNGSGSSPRVWGQVQFQTAVSRRLRIIPTRVGTSKQRHTNPNPCKDHPHACGDKVWVSDTRYHSYGSSPRVWGQVGSFFQACMNIRIIPTRVGTSKF